MKRFEFEFNEKIDFHNRAVKQAKIKRHLWLRHPVGHSVYERRIFQTLTNRSKSQLTRE